MDRTSTVSTSLPKSFRRFVYAVSTQKLNIFEYLCFSTRKTILWTRKTVFWHLGLVSFAKSHKFLFSFPEMRKKQIFRELIFLKRLLWTVQVHFCQPCQQVFPNRKMIFRTRKINFWHFRKNSFAIRHKKNYSISQEKKKKFQRTSFPQNVTVDKTKTVLTRRPKGFDRLFFCCKYAKTKHLCLFKFF